MPNLLTRRLMSILLMASLLLGLFLLVGIPVQAAQTATDTPPVSDTPIPGDTPAAADTATPAETLVPTDTPASASPEATSQSQNDVWSPPVNLSQSGAASAPVIAAEANGSLHVLWWDKFDGTKYAYQTPGKGWSKPVTVATIVGSRPTSQSPSPGAPHQLRLFVDNSRVLHAFWIDGRGNLLYAQSRAGATNSWTAGLQLATAPLAWDVTLDSVGSMHVAYIRPGSNPQLPSGVYYRLSSNSGLLWENALAINESPYFRTLDPAAAHVSVAANGQGTVLVAWDDPQLKRSFFVQSQNGGKAFADPVKIQAADVIQDDSVLRARFLALPGGQFLRLWQAGDNCLLYQQQSDDKLEQWSVPLRVLQDLGGCPQDMRAMPMPDNQLLVSISLAESPVGLALTIWDGQAWAPTQSPRVSFVDAVTNLSTALSCIDATPMGSQVALIGCAAGQDVWATTSLKDATQLLPALTTAWNPPIIVSKIAGDADLPAVAAETDGRMHALWSQTSPDGGLAGTLNYSRGDGTSWTAPAAVLASPHGGKAADPALLADQAGSVHAVWSGGFAGEVYYSHSFIRDAATTSGWSSPMLLPAPVQAGSSPALAVDSAARLHLIYAIPLNEARGVYYTRSNDEGATWSAPQKIFDAAAAGWPLVTDTHLVIDGQNHLQATWVQSALPPSTTNLGIYYSRSEDGGQTWTEPVQVSGVDTGYPVLAATGPGELHLLWSANLSGQVQLWHQWSTDGGATWSKGTPLIGLRDIAPRADLATDGAGSLYLIGIQRTAGDSAALFYLRWDQGIWTDHETLPIGFSADAASGARAIILPDGRLGAFYRVRAPTGNGGSHYVLGYSQRPVQVSLTTPEPTLTSQPTSTIVPSSTPAATLTPAPTPDLNTPAVSPVSQRDLLRIGGILLGMIVVVIVALIGLRLGQR